MGSSVRPTGIATPPGATPELAPWDRRYLERLTVPAADASSVARQAGPSVGLTPRYRLPRPDGGSRDAYPGQTLVRGATDFLPIVGDIKGAAEGGEALAEGHPFRAAFMLAASALPGLPKGVGKRFYSRLANAITGAPFEKGTAEQWAAALGKNVAKGEREYTGVDQFLADNKGKVLNRADVQGAYDRGAVNLGETVRGDTPEDTRYSGMVAQAHLAESHFLTARNTLRDRILDALAPAFGADVNAGPWTTRVLNHGVDVLPEGARVGPAARAEMEQLRATANAANDRYTQLTQEAQLNRPANQATRRPKYGAYTEPGGDNYRELLIQEERPTKVMDQIARDLGYGGWHANLTREQGAEIARAFDAQRFKPGDTYKSGHFDEPNILAHLRMKDRAGPGGDRTLFLEELQSDWHQAGREKGYKPRATPELRDLEAEVEHAGQEYERARNAYYNGRGLEDNEAAHQAYTAASNRYDELATRLAQMQGPEHGVPDAPFKRTEDWAGLGFRRALSEAAEGNYDRLAWTTGAQQARRYDLRKEVGAMYYNPENNRLFVMSPSEMTTVHQGFYDPRALESVIGKETAAKLLASPLERTAGGKMEHVIRGDDMAFGGEGMHAFYDKMLPNVARETGKRLGIPLELEPAHIFESRRLPDGAVLAAADAAHGRGEKQLAEVLAEVNRQIGDSGVNDSNWRRVLHHVGRDNAQAIARGDDWAFDPAVIQRAEEVLAAGERDAPANPSIRITPELRKRILESGLPLWAGVGAIGLGMYGLTPKPEGDR